MPVTKNVRVFKGKTDTPELDHLEPYEVSDEQLAQEAEDARREELTGKLIRTNKENSELLTIISKRL